LWALNLESFFPGKRSLMAKPKSLMNATGQYEAVVKLPCCEYDLLNSNFLP